MTEAQSSLDRLVAIEVQSKLAEKQQVIFVCLYRCWNLESQELAVTTYVAKQWSNQCYSNLLLLSVIKTANFSWRSYDFSWYFLYSVSVDCHSYIWLWSPCSILADWVTVPELLCCYNMPLSTMSSHILSNADQLMMMMLLIFMYQPFAQLSFLLCCLMV